MMILQYDHMIYYFDLSYIYIYWALSKTTVKLVLLMQLYVCSPVPIWTCTVAVFDQAPTRSQTQEPKANLLVDTMDDTQQESQPEAPMEPQPEPSTTLPADDYRITVAKATTSISITVPRTTQIRLADMEEFEEALAQCQKRQRREVTALSTMLTQSTNADTICAMEKDLWTKTLLWWHNRLSACWSRSLMAIPKWFRFGWSTEPENNSCHEFKPCMTLCKHTTRAWGTGGWGQYVLVCLVCHILAHTQDSCTCTTLLSSIGSSNTLLQAHSSISQTSHRYHATVLLNLCSMHVQGYTNNVST